MEQRLSLVSFRRSRHENLGLAASKSSSNDQITFFQLGGIILGLYSLISLVENLIKMWALGLAALPWPIMPDQKNKLTSF